MNLPPDLIASAAQRIYNKATWDGECLIPHVKQERNGYTRTRLGTERDGTRTRIGTHRLIYEYHNGPIPDGMEIDHLCCNRRCILIDHLRVVTPQTNQLRSSSVSGTNARKTHCLRGHLFDILTTQNKGHQQRRRCRICEAMWARKRYARDPERFKREARESREYRERLNRHDRPESPS